MKYYAQKIFSRDGYNHGDILEEGHTGLDVGCGGRRSADVVGMDHSSLSKADIIHDCNVFPWPFKDGEFDVVIATMIFEHVQNPLATLQEIHRVLKPNGRAVIQTPYFRSIDAYQDLDHRNFFTYHSFDDGTYSRFDNTSFEFHKLAVWFGWPSPSKNLLKRGMQWFLNTFPNFYEHILSKFWCVEHRITWELEKVEKTIISQK